MNQIYSSHAQEQQLSNESLPALHRPLLCAGIAALALYGSADLGLRILSAPSTDKMADLNGPAGDAHSIVAVIKDGKEVLYAAGQFAIDSSGQFAHNELSAHRSAVIKFDGKHWETLQEPSSGSIYRLCRAQVQKKDCIFGLGEEPLQAGSSGHGFILELKDDAWTKIADCPDGYVTNVCSWRGKLYAGGRFDSISSQKASSLAVWDGEKWEAVADLSGNVFSMVSTENQLVIGGNFELLDGRRVNGVASYNGKIWAPMADGLTKTGVAPAEGETAQAYGAVIALGAAGNSVIAIVQALASGSQSATLECLIWNGGQWQEFTTPTGAIINQFTQIGDHSIIVASKSLSSLFPLQSDFTLFDGERWSSLPHWIYPPMQHAIQSAEVSRTTPDRFYLGILANFPPNSELPTREPPLQQGTLN